MRQNIDPKLWGSSGWTFLKYCAEGSDACSFETLLNALPDILPCEECRFHCRQYVDTHPVVDGDFALWMQEFQDAVSARKATSPPAARCQCKTSSSGHSTKNRSLSPLQICILTLAAIVALIALVWFLAKMTKNKK